jgi:hypothetical protein
VLAGEDGNHVRSYLVGSISIAGNPIGAYHDGIDLAAFHHVPRHVVSDNRNRNFILGKFPGSQAQSLQKWPGFISNHSYAFSGVYGPTDNTECGSVIAGGSEGPGITMRQYGVAIREQFSAKTTQGTISLNVFPKNVLGLFNQTRFDLFQAVGAGLFSL